MPTMTGFSRSGPHCIKLTSNGKLDFNGNFHRILDADWLWCLVAMVVTIESKVTINGKFYATGPRRLHTSYMYHIHPNITMMGCYGRIGFMRIVTVGNGWLVISSLSALSVFLLLLSYYCFFLSVFVVVIIIIIKYYNCYHYYHHNNYNYHHYCYNVSFSL